VNDLPEGVETSALIDSLADKWGFLVETIDYVPVGFGSYHWVVTEADGAQGFVTVDDLERKPWFGDTPESALSGLRSAFDSARALRDAGLAFVVAPISATDGETVHRIGARHSIALFPFVDGQAGRHFEYDSPDERATVVILLAELHGATSAAESIARTIELDVPGRADIDAGLRDVNEIWSGGPFSEPARRALNGRASEVAEVLRLFDRLARDVAARSDRWVVTHGEPHPVNFIRTDTGRMLVDWDTVALGPPERDLWMVLRDTGDDATRYADATGHVPDPVALDFFRLMWDLSDMAAYLDVVRSPHVDSDDTAKAFDGLTKTVAIRDQWAPLLA
jgi:spectinomycin phosphotransferase